MIYNPGTNEAIAQGCICPVIDNHYGKGVPQMDGTRAFWIEENCPMHGKKDGER
jgi:hypothetical protein